MMRVLLLGLSLLLVMSCSHQQTAAQARQNIESQYHSKIGTATKQDIMEEFGNPEWCKLDDSGAETCRFILKKGVKWINGTDKTDKTELMQFDQITAQFDSDGILRGFKANAQR